MNNVIARFNTKASKQIMISAHWDTRPWGDRGSGIMEKNQPIMGANDGASTDKFKKSWPNSIVHCFAL